MQNLSKEQAQRRTDQILAFRQELAQLQNENIASLDEVQLRAISDHHELLLQRFTETLDVDRTIQSKQLSLGMRIASLLGALAFAASVYFLFYHFWGYFTTVLQVGVLITAPMVTYVATIFLAARERTGYFSKLLAMISFACFVLNITMLGQIFNITPSDNAFLAWAAFAFLLAYQCNVRLLLVAGILCVTGFLAARVGAWNGGYWLGFGERPENFLPAAVVLFLIPWWLTHRRFDGFAPIYRVFALSVLFIPILILAHWGNGSYFMLSNTMIEHTYQVAGFVLSAAVIALGIHRHWAEVVNTANVFFVIFLYTKLYDWWWEWLPKYVFFLIVGITAVVFLFVFMRLRRAMGTGLAGGAHVTVA